ncbi:hypothetical protein [Vibrio splendidus]|uniref:hypothetical protein n=1 Tax=Vibrio splendidus TaxID=29497 RepID=UPI001F52EC2D|nr:hypothetical protein [Vibrio splendidus]
MISSLMLMADLNRSIVYVDRVAKDGPPYSIVVGNPAKVFALFALMTLVRLSD